MGVLFSDNYNRADSSNLGANWSEDSGDWAISSNQLQAPTGNGFPASAQVVTTTGTAMSPTADMKVTVTVNQGSAWDGGPLLRRTGANTFYGCDIYLSGAQWKADILRHNGSLSSNTTVATANVAAHAAVDKYRGEIQGTAIRIYRNRSGVETLLVSGTDSVISAAGQAGVYNWSRSNHLLDDFTVEDFAAGGDPDQPARQKSGFFFVP